jgi:alpha-glucosidase
MDTSAATDQPSASAASATPSAAPRDWLADQVVYQIFPDRFAIGGRMPSEQKLRSAAYPADIVRKHWHDPPEQPPRGRDFFGGDLAGIADALDYIRGLGATCLYLTPIFKATSNHKYDTLDYLAVDPMFGTDADFDRLLSAVHGRGMRLVLDAVLNHVSDRHPWHLARKSDPRVAEYFLRIDGQEQYWRNYGQLAELDLTHPDVEGHFYRREDAVIPHWLARGIDGWRFDTAQDLGLPFIRRLAAAVRPRFPDRVLWGELTNFPGGEWTGPDRYDGVMNYYYRTSVLGFAGGTLPAREAGDCHQELYDQMGHTAATRSLIILSSHDTPRLMTEMRGDEARVLAAMTLQFTLPGIPMIYYGEENGMTGAADPDNRRGMVWEPDRWNRRVREHLLKLTALRRDRRELRRGAFRDLTARAEGKVLAFMRTGRQPGEFSLTVANAAPEPRTARLVVPYPHLYDGIKLVDALGSGRSFTALGARVDAEVPPKSALVLVPDPKCIPRFHFYKPRNRLEE